MSPVDGPIGLNLKICNLDTTDVNISKVQPCEANGLDGVHPQRNKSPTIYYIYKRESHFISDRFTPKLMDQSGRMMALLKGCIMLSVL